MPRSFLVKSTSPKVKVASTEEEAPGHCDVNANVKDDCDVMKKTCLTDTLDSPPLSEEDTSDVEIDVIDTEDGHEEELEETSTGVVAPKCMSDLRYQTSPTIGDEPLNNKTMPPCSTPSLQSVDRNDWQKESRPLPWQFHISAARAHPFLALSFQRLQQLHLQAMQERMKFGHLQPFPASQFPMQLPPPAATPAFPFMSRTPETNALPLYLSPTRLMQVGAARMQPKWDADAAKPPFSPETPMDLAKKLSGDGIHSAFPSSMPWNPRPMTSFNIADVSRDNRKRREDPPRYQCEACGKSYATFSGLSKHKQFHCSTHVKKQFTCKYCEKNYVSLGALKMHIRTHTLPCKCPLCGKAFSRPWLLQGHIRTHTGEKPFKCQHCVRAFADRSNLRAHLQTHTDIKKYTCKSCPKTFSRMSLLLKHEDGGCPGLSR